MSERPDPPSGFSSGDPLGGPSEPLPPPPDLPDEPSGPFGPSSSEPAPAAPPAAPEQPGPAQAPPDLPIRPPAPPVPDGPGALPEQPTTPGAPPSPAADPAPPSSAAHSAPPSSGGLWGSGDPLAGSSGLPGSGLGGPSGYTSPAPPGAGGLAPPSDGFNPAQPGRHVLAGWGSRVGAQLIDGLIVGIGSLVLFFIFGAIFSVGFGDDADDPIGAVIVALLLWFVCVAVIALLYAPALMARTNGQTWGRQVMNIRVVRTSGEPITFGFAVIREVVVKALGVGLVASLTFGIVYLIDILWPLWDEENRALHDFVVNTRTVKTN